LSTPNFFSRFAIVSGLTPLPAWGSKGLPGVSVMMTKVTAAIASSVGMNQSIRPTA
jgi:hypothetical protein